jgi:hypothetical protein
MAKSIWGYPSSIHSNKRVGYYPCGDGRSVKDIQSRMTIMSSHDKKSGLAGEPTSMTIQGERTEAVEEEAPDNDTKIMIVEDNNRTSSFGVIVDIDAFDEQRCSMGVKVDRAWGTRLE